MHLINVFGNVWDSDCYCYGAWYGDVSFQCHCLFMRTLSLTGKSDLLLSKIIYICQIAFINVPARHPEWEVHGVQWYPYWYGGTLSSCWPGICFVTCTVAHYTMFTQPSQNWRHSCYTVYILLAALQILNTWETIVAWSNSSSKLK